MTPSESAWSCRIRVRSRAFSWVRALGTRAAQPSYPLADTRKHRHIKRMGNASRHRWISRHVTSTLSRRTLPPLLAKNPAPT